MTTIKKFEMTIGGKKKYISILDVFPEQNQKPVRTHHILQLDRSGSMYSSIKDLINQVKTAIKSIPENDLLTVQWFASPGQNGVIYQGSSIQAVAVEVLDKFASVLGCTCFSQVTEESKKISRIFSSSVDQTVVTVFTDGCPVVPWSYHAELERTLAQLDAIENLAAVNAIGYGYYYNKAFLEALVEQGGPNGLFIHSSEIKDFDKIFSDNVNRAAGLVNHGVQISSPGDILYTGSSSRYLTKDWFSTNRVDRVSNKFYVVNDYKNDLVEVDDVIVTDIQEVKQKDLSVDEVEDFLYAYASRLYYNGRRQEALDIVVNSLRDKYLADSMINSFSIDEVANTQAKLDDADLSYGARRLNGRCAPGYLPKKDAFCFFNFLDLFEKHEAYYVPFSKNVGEYNRINRKATDEYNVFEKSDEEVITPMSDLVWNKEYLNLSVRFVINGIVKINPRAAEKVGLDPNFKSHIFRSHTFVKDGQLNIKVAEFLVPDVFLEELVKNKVTFEPFGTADVNGNTFNRVVIDLTSMPIINRVYIDTSADVSLIAKKTLNILALEAKIKVINKLLGEARESNSNLNKTGFYKTYTADQIAVLEEHGISRSGSYNGVAVTRPKAEDSDSYECRTLEFYVKGASSLPKNEDFEKMLDGSKKPNVPGEFMIDAYEKIKSHPDFGTQRIAFVRDLEDLLKISKEELVETRNQLNAIKLAKILTNDFFEGLVPNDKGEYTVPVGNYTVVLRNAMKTVYI